MRKLKKIEVLRELLNENISILRCPVCKKSIKYIKESSVLCENNHCFNISKKGYVNLVKNNAKTYMIKNYLNLEVKYMNMVYMTSFLKR